MSETISVDPLIKQPASREARVAELRNHLITKCSTTNLLNHRWNTLTDPRTSWGISGCCGSKIIDHVSGRYIGFVELSPTGSRVREDKDYIKKDACGFYVFPKIKKEELPLKRLFSEGVPYVVKEFTMGKEPLTIVWRDF